MNLTDLLIKYPPKLNFPNWLIEQWNSYWGEKAVESFIKFLIKEPYLDISVAGDPEDMKSILKAEPLYWKTLRKYKAGNPSTFKMFYPNAYYSYLGSKYIPPQIMFKICPDGIQFDSKIHILKYA